MCTMQILHNLFTTEGEELDDLDHDLSYLSEVSNIYAHPPSSTAVRFVSLNKRSKYEFPRNPRYQS